ncbi:MAG TPA: patatin-like phospholipase family protein, partial [Candidatus Wallbacteria bacterium]|nr:patatin-like phospholipase family protein [Candidatus Wallbacteria bacterium]
MPDIENTEKKTGKKRPKIAVVIGSGGIKPMATIPLFDFLDENNINIDWLFGCSGGAIVAAMRGAGYNGNQMRDIISKYLSKKLFSKIDYRTLLGIAKLPFGRFNKTCGILKPQNLIEVLKIIYKGMKFEELKTPTFIQATDVETGEGVTLNTGDVAEAVYASAAQFPFFPPYCVNGKWLVDGVYSSPLPVLEAVKKGADII